MGMGIASPLRQLVARTGVSLFCLNIPLLAQAEQAQENAAEEKPALTMTGNVTLVNDYIWRGLTQTWGNPALQAGVEASHDSGGYLGFWGSNVSDRWVPGANLELDLYGGIRRKFPDAPDFGFDLGVIYVYYPDGDYDEAFERKDLQVIEYQHHGGLCRTVLQMAIHKVWAYVEQVLRLERE